jgi:hypothetical protein
VKTGQTTLDCAVSGTSWWSGGGSDEVPSIYSDKVRLAARK